MTNTTFLAPDIECGGCANAIRNALGTLPGVSEVSVNLDDKRVHVVHDERAITVSTLMEALDHAGFPAMSEPVASQ